VLCGAVLCGAVAWQCGAVAVRCGAVAVRSWWTERARRARARVVACAGSILAGGAESENIPRSDRERVEGFQLTPMSAVAVLSAVAVTTASERVGGFQLTPMSAVAVLSGVAVTTA